MAKFYGTIRGSAKTAATRRGFNRIKTSAQSWNGSITTELTYNDEDKLMVEISIDEGSSTYGKTIFYGTFEEFVNKLKTE